MSDDKINLISKDIEFVKDIVQDTSRRMSNLEDATNKFSRDFHEHISVDRQMGNEIVRIGQILEKNTDSLVEHMRRTEINEMNINELKSLNMKLDQRLQPIESSHLQFKTLMILIGKIFAVVAGMAGLIKFLYELYILKPW